MYECNDMTRLVQQLKNMAPTIEHGNQQFGFIAPDNDIPMFTNASNLRLLFLADDVQGHSYVVQRYTQGGRLRGFISTYFYDFGWKLEGMKP